jgi:Fe2+ or Zn2+ uptake regulation protein
VEEAKIEKYLVDCGVRPLRKRVKIMRYLVTKRNHPTVDTIYSDLVHEIPGLSKTTVYNVLKLFVENKMVWALNVEDNEIRYDADTSVHGHFKCDVCGSVFDFDVKKEMLPDSGLSGFEVDEFHYYLKGTCAFCKQKKL